MTRAALFVSPHLDDVGFSCPEVVLRFAEAGYRVVVATVFTASVPGPTGFALACQLDKGLSAEVDYMALRRAEDSAFAAALGAEVRHLGLAEAPHRGYDSVNALFGPVYSRDSARADAVRCLAALWDELAPDVCFLPVGIGVHVDHTIVIDALNSVASTGRAAPLLRYADQPYALNHPERADAAIGGLDARVYRVHGTSDTRRRALDAVAAYASQLDFQFGGRAAMQTALASVFMPGTPLWSRAPDVPVRDALIHPAQV